MQGTREEEAAQRWEPKICVKIYHCSLAGGEPSLSKARFHET